MEPVLVREPKDNEATPTLGAERATAKDVPVTNAPAVANVFTDPNDALAAKLKGKTLRVPSMWPIIGGWPHGGTSPHYHRLKAGIDEILDRVVPDAKRRQKFKDCDFALFCALWWPTAEYANLHIAARFVTWIFIWDDTIDTNEETLSDDFAQACAFRAQTLGYARYCLGLDDSATAAGDGVVHRDTAPVFPSLACTLFREFAEKAVEIYDRAHLLRMYAEIVRFIGKCEIEQADRLAGHIPGVEEYLKNRMGTSAVFIFCSTLELFLGINLPDWIMESPEIETLWCETNLGIIIINDILSLKKEMDTGVVINLVPVLYKAGKGWDDIVPDMLTELAACRDRLDDAAHKLCGMASGDEKLRADLIQYIRGCRLSNTGTYQYSLLSQRYRITDNVGEDGSAEIVL